MKVLLWTGGDAPSRESELHVVPRYNNLFYAYWEPGYCGCEDCHPIVGEGETEAEATQDYWEKWEDRHGAERVN